MTKKLIAILMLLTMTAGCLKVDRLAEIADLLPDHWLEKGIEDPDWHE